jgi:hypothetical protein
MGYVERMGYVDFLIIVTRVVIDAYVILLTIL